MTVPELIELSASVATSVGVGIAAYQLFETRRQQRTQLEDGMSDQYRRIIRRLPLDALLGKRLSWQTLTRHLGTFYEYFDLSNQQAEMGATRQLSPETWARWRSGIDAHMRRPAFSEAWKVLLPDLDDSFEHLRSLLPLGPPAAGPSNADRRL